MDTYPRNNSRRPEERRNGNKPYDGSRDGWRPKEGPRNGGRSRDDYRSDRRRPSNSNRNDSRRPSPDDHRNRRDPDRQPREPRRSQQSSRYRDERRDDWRSEDRRRPRRPQDERSDRDRSRNNRNRPERREDRKRDDSRSQRPMPPRSNRDAYSRRSDRRDDRPRNAAPHPDRHDPAPSRRRMSEYLEIGEKSFNEARNRATSAAKEARGRATDRYNVIDQGLGSIVSTKLLLFVLCALLIVAIVSLGARFALSMANKGNEVVDTTIATIEKRAESCKLSEKEVTSRLEAVGVEDTWAEQAGTLSQTDARFQTMAQKSEELGREGEEVTNKLVKLAVSDPEAVDYVVGFIDKYPQTEAQPYTESVEKGTVPLLFQWDQRWGYLEYSSTTFGCTGCGPTTMSMVYMGLTGQNDMSPADMAELANKDGYETDNEGTLNQFFLSEAEPLGLTVRELDVTAEELTDALEDGMPVICNVGPGDFTLYGHFIVITGINEDDTLNINDPFSSVNSAETWDIDQVIGQTVALYAYKLS